MRELKIRVWDNLLKEFKALDSYFCRAKDGILTVCTNNDDITLDLPTGFKDKNGKEIYEGDIVHITPYFKKKGGKRFMAQEPYRNPLSVIEWDDGAGAFSENTYENGEFQIGGFLFEMALDSETLEGTQRHIIEVIGNIHENPELLEDKK